MVRTTLLLWMLLGLLGTGVLAGQSANAVVKVYDVTEGLSHRNVFKILQDDAGMVWLGTINGLNAFDGYAFRHLHPQSATGRLPHEMVTDMVALPGQTLLVASPDYMTHVQRATYAAQPVQIKKGNIVRRESLLPSNFCRVKDRVWCTVFDEKTGENALAYYQKQTLKRVRALDGAHTRRPLVHWQKSIWVANADRQLLRLDADGKLQATQRIGTGAAANVADMRVKDGRLWILLDNGELYIQDKPDATPHAWTYLPPLPADAQMQSLWITTDNAIWMGGRGQLWHYDAWTQTWKSHDPAIREIIKNTCTYRQILQDAAGVVWLATDFGAITITLTDHLFTGYLHGGSEYCSNLYCSTRGITEDEAGNVYISYYNAMHVIDADTRVARPLFPRGNFFNFPFGIVYHGGALYTGNGLRIQLGTLRVDTLFAHTAKDIGAVIVDRQERIWLGYDRQLHCYQPRTRRLQTPEQVGIAWDTLNGVIAHLYESPSSGDIWVGTLTNGVFRLGADGSSTHYHTGDGSPVPLPHPQVNAVLETAPGQMWLSTGYGLAHLDTQAGRVTVYDASKGLPNNFINGTLSEGDSCLWISTDNGLCRLSIASGNTTQYFDTDGLTANEFNRISFYKSSTGAFYFGGLNGVNVFTPDARYLQRAIRRPAPLLVTDFSYLDGKTDSLTRATVAYGPKLQPVELSHRDRMFTITFSLLDFRMPRNHTFQHFLEGYDSDWSEETTSNVVRYSDLPPGEYTLRLRARANQEDWTEATPLPIRIAPAIYQRAWFWPLMVVLGIGLLLAVMQYRVYVLDARRHELEAEVAARTQELALEKQKSEELLLNILPAGLADELKRNGYAKAKRHEQVTVMFSDFKGFSRISGLLEPEELVAEIDLCFRAFDEITERHQLEKIKTIGDAYLMVGGIGEAATDQARRVVLAALEIQEFMAAIAVEKQMHQQHFFEARIGIHTGPLVAGIVGIKKFAYDIWGDTVNIASRMETHGMVGQVNLSEDTYQLVKGDFLCEPYGRFVENNTNIAMYLVKEVRDSWDLTI